MVTMQNKKIVLFFLPGSVGGAERMTVTIAKMLPLDEFIVKFVIVGKNRGNIEDFIPNEYDVLFVKIRNVYDFLTLRLYRIIRHERADYAFCSLRVLSARVILASQMFGKCKVIIRSENTWIKPYNFRRKVNHFYYRHSFPKAFRIITQQEEMRKDMLDYMPSLLPEKVLVMHNPLDYNRIDDGAKASNPYPADECINYVWVGSFSPEEGQDILVKAFSIVHAKSPISHLYFVGKYDFNKKYDKSIRDFVESNGLTHFVHFIGFDVNPYRWMKYCNCFVLPSRHEGLPNSLLEAMYLERPVVAAVCIPVIERIVEEGVNGYKVKSEDCVAMSEAMLKAVKLSNCKLTFRSASKEDFVNLFN